MIVQLTEFSSSQKTAMKLDQLSHELRRTRSMVINKLLRHLGAARFNIMLPETHALPYLIKDKEEIRGIVYGRYRSQNGFHIGRGALVVTDNRILLIDKKPFFEKVDELTFKALSGVTYSRAGIAGTVTLHSKIGDISVRTFNHKCAQSFVKAVDATLFKKAH